MSSIPSISGEHLDQALELPAQQRLAAGDAQLAHALSGEHAHESRDLLEAEQLGTRQEAVARAVDLAGHAVAAAEIAAVGDGDAQIAKGCWSRSRIWLPRSTRSGARAKLRGVSRDEWIAAFAGAASVTAPTEREVEQLLALAGTAAHASERTAAPLACWIAGRSGLSLDRLGELAELVHEAEEPGLDS